MGYYINPEGQSKEAWLRQHGKNISASQVMVRDWEEGPLPVCLVDNGAFTAAGIAYDSREAEEFLYPDGRRKIWYEVGRKELEPFYKA